jgi:hypothetical protein
VANPYVIHDMVGALRERLHPAVTVWNRLEARPRTIAFDRSLKAEVRDALWMLTRQWQVGEFQGEDAGSPILTRASFATSPLTKYRPDLHDPEPFEDTLPLEAKVERRPLQLVVGGREVALEMRLIMGRHWLKLVADFPSLRQAWIDRYPVELPNPASTADVDRSAHPEVWQAYAAAAGRGMDGGRFYTHLKADPGNHAYDGIAVGNATDQATIDTRAQKFVAWFERSFLQPTDLQTTAWLPERLEYQLACSTQAGDAEKVFTAEEYARGRLDWHDFDVDARSEGLGDVGLAAPSPRPPLTRTMLPTPVTFDGMPDPRWWAFEDRRTNLGLVDAATTDLAKLLFVEFGLVFSNDWFSIPFTIESGQAASVRGIAVTNVFGERYWIEPAGAGTENDWQRWTMFTHTLTGQSEGVVDDTLLLLPSAPKIQDGEPVEEVLLLRDEMANMVWGAEQTVRLSNGESKSGSEAGLETRAFFERLAGPAPEPPPGALGANIRYRLMTGVAENLIPFISVHVDGSNREIQLQRAAMPRIIPGNRAPPEKVRPRTSLLREGLDASPPAPYFVYEEEVPRAGARVYEHFRRTRWYDGRAVVWLGAHKETGRGEGSSTLDFDQIVDVTPSQP